MPTVSDWDNTLSCWMADVQCSSWAQLQRTASLSRYRIRQLRQCQLDSWSLRMLQDLCMALNISLTELLTSTQFIHPKDGEPNGSSENTLLSQQQSSTPDSHRQATLQVLEPLLRQLPTAAFAVQHHNLPASQLLKILQPLESLLTEWDVIALGCVGQVVPFDPTWQSPLTDAEYKRDTPVSIRYVGYRVGRRTWIKAQVRAEA
ncbi:MAG: helix-turn-helix domain-containing protein [Synechococcus sp.]